MLPDETLEWFHAQGPQRQVVFPSHSDHITTDRNCTLIAIRPLYDNFEIDMILGNFIYKYTLIKDFDILVLCSQELRNEKLIVKYLAVG